jgi:hypothetical protein
VRRGCTVPIIASHNVVSYTVRQGYGGPKVVSDEDILEDASPFSFRYASQSVRDIMHTDTDCMQDASRVVCAGRSAMKRGLNVRRVDT